MKTENEICICGHEKINHKIGYERGKCVIKGCPCKKFTPQKQDNPENFDDGLTKVAPKGQFHRLWRCKECGSDKKGHNKEICHKCYMRKWNDTEKARKYRENYEDKNATKRKLDYEKRNPDKIKAKHIAQSKVKIEGLCQICGENKAELRHHFDYNKPNEVFLLCKRCHYNVHKKLRDKEYE